jgi:hypothetical protein
MRKKELGFICIGHVGEVFFLNKDTGKIIFAKSIGKAEYLPNRIIRLKEKFPLNQTVREELIIKIRKEYKLLTQKT